MKKIFAALLAGLMLLTATMTGCAKDGGAGVTTPATTEETPELTPKDAKYDSITIDGVALSEYTIVYAPDAYKRAIKTYPDSFTVGDTNFAKLIADELATVLFNMTGVQLSVVADTTSAVDREILVGDTNRKQSDANAKDLTTYNYKVAMADGKLCINGGSSGANYHALDALYEAFEAQNNANVSIAADFALSGDADLITVACVGDSITEGWASSSNQYCSWPSVLQRILWKDYIIVNYGVSGKTMREDLNDAYIKTDAYTRLKNEAQNADITLIMLGTNDSNRDQNWNDESTAKFNEGCENLVSMIEERRPDMTYFIMDCPVYSGNENYGSATVRGLQKKLVTSLADKGYDMHYFDMYSYTSKKITLALFDDGLHPNDKGYVKMAEGVCELLETYRAGEYTK